MATPRSGAGGKIVTDRRKQGSAATPYDRPPQFSPLKSPNWFSAVVVPSARAIASGAGKILASIFSESSSSEDEDYASASALHIVSEGILVGSKLKCSSQRSRICRMCYEIDNATSSKMVPYRQNSRLSVWRSESKKIIEQLIIKETFTSEEYDRMIKVLNSRVINWSVEAGEKSSVVSSPRNKLDRENADIFEKAVQDTKRWFQEKEAGLSSVIEFPQGSSNLKPTTLKDVDNGGCSPVDVAKSYMKTRSHWASPGRNTELKSPSTVSSKVFQEETICAAGPYSVSSSENRRSFASGSWNIQEELRRVRSKATEDMLCSSLSTITDPSCSAVARIRMGSPRAGVEVFAMGERMTQPQSLGLHRPIDALVDVGASSLAALKRQVREAREALSSKPETSVSGNNEVAEIVWVRANVELSASKIIPPSSPDHAEAPHSGLQLCKISSSPAREVTKIVERESANGLSSSQVSLSIGDQMENCNIINVEEGKCELLSEAYMEVPNVTETNSTVSGYWGQLYEELALEERKQQGRKTIKYNRRRSRGRGK